MHDQQFVRDVIQSAWDACITSDYLTCRINSERSLQASFWAQLNERLLPKESWLMFIEPGLKLKRHGKVFPDIVVCDTAEETVVAVIELKFQPRIKGKWKKDIETLDRIHADRESLFFKNVRHDREGESPEFPLADDTLFVWAGIHLPLGKDLKSLIGDSQWIGNFIELHHPTEKRAKNSNT